MPAPRLTVAETLGRALMIHAQADRYTAHAAHHDGKGGTRMCCAVIPAKASP